MAKWRRHGRRVVVQDNSWWVPTALRGVIHDGAASADAVRCDQPVAAAAELASCAPVVKEFGDIDADSTPVLE